LGRPSHAESRAEAIARHIIEDATLIKLASEGTTKMHVRFKDVRTETLMTLNPKSSAQQITTQPKIVELVDQLLDNHICSEIADILQQARVSSRRLGAKRP
jgi:hypothetical protein